MSERYSRLFALQSDLYTAGSPVVIAAGALLKDNQTGKVLAQLKLRSISPKQIKAVKVCITALDTVGRTLGEAVEHTYLDLNILRDAEFGQKSAIPLPDPATRSFSAVVTEVAFADNTVWAGGSGVWEPLPRPVPLSVQLKDVELAKQYQLTYGKQCRVWPTNHQDLWYCTCGAVNHENEDTCHACGLALSKLHAVGLSALAEQRDVRLAQEAAYAKRLAEEQAEREAKRKAEEEWQQAMAAAKAKKHKKIGIVCAVLAVAVCAAAYVVTQIILPGQAQKEAYAKAQALFEAEKYEEAIAAFTDLGEYKDSSEMVTTVSETWQEARYQSAKAALNAEDYESAKAQFEALDNYKDSSEQATAAADLHETHQKYLKAVDQLGKGQYAAAIAGFEKLAGYKDSGALLEQAKNQKLESDYQEALAAYNNGNYAHAQTLFASLGQYKDSEAMSENAAEKATETQYNRAMDALSKKQYTLAYMRFRELGDYKDSTKQLIYCLKQSCAEGSAPFGMNLGINSYASWTVLKRTGNTYLLFCSNLHLTSLELTDTERSFISQEPQHPTKEQADLYLLSYPFMKGWYIHLQDGYDICNGKIFTCDSSYRFHNINNYLVEITLP